MLRISIRLLIVVCLACATQSQLLSKDDIFTFNKELIVLHDKTIDFLSNEKIRSAKLLFEHNKKTLNRVTSLISLIKQYEVNAVKYVARNQGNHTPEATCLGSQQIQMEKLVVGSIEAGLGCMTVSTKSMKSLTNQYFYTLVNEMFRQSTASQHLSLYAIGQYNPLTESSYIVQTLQSTIAFSNFSWNGTVENIQSEIRHIDAGAGESVDVLEKCDCDVFKNYWGSLKQNVCKTLQC